MREDLLTAAALPDDDVVETTLRPQTLEEFVGQPKLKERLAISIEAARTLARPLDHVLLSGPPGLGKTTMAGILANEMGSRLRITSGPALERPGDVASILTNLDNGDVFFVDEIHRLPRAVEEVLYPAMEDFQLDIVLGKGPSAQSIRLDLPHFTLVGATTRKGKVAAPLAIGSALSTNWITTANPSSAGSSAALRPSSTSISPMTAPTSSPCEGAGPLASPTGCWPGCVTMRWLGPTERRMELPPGPPWRSLRSMPWGWTRSIERSWRPSW